MTNFFSLAIGIIWIIFLVVWLPLGLTAKTSVSGTRGKWLLYRLGIFILIYALIRYTDFFGTIGLYHSSSPIIQGLGVVLTALGVGIAFWARFYIGRNWGMPMSEKKNPELVTGGPYAYIRHPIYAGILLALVGSTLTLGLYFAIVFLACGLYFLYSAKIEQKNMLRTFPETYPEYKKRTKMFIPFVF